MTGSDIAKAIQKLNEENQRLRDALCTRERDVLEAVVQDIQNAVGWPEHNDLESLFNLGAHSGFRQSRDIVCRRLAALTPEGANDD